MCRFGHGLLSMICCVAMGYAYAQDQANVMGIVRLTDANGIPVPFSISAPSYCEKINGRISVFVSSGEGRSFQFSIDERKLVCNKNMKSSSFPVQLSETQVGKRYLPVKYAIAKFNCNHKNASADFNLYIDAELCANQECLKLNARLASKFPKNSEKKLN